MAYINIVLHVTTIFYLCKEKRYCEAFFLPILVAQPSGILIHFLVLLLGDSSLIDHLIHIVSPKVGRLSATTGGGAIVIVSQPDAGQ